MKLCAITGCKRPAKAKGLCAMHRMRQLRGTDPAKPRKPGRPKDDFRAYTRKLFAEWSDRAFARYWWAFKTLMDLVGLVGFQDVINKSSRPGGGINIAELERRAQHAIFHAVKASQSKKPRGKT